RHRRAGYPRLPVTRPPSRERGPTVAGRVLRAGDGRSLGPDQQHPQGLPRRRRPAPALRRPPVDRDRPVVPAALLHPTVAQDRDAGAILERLELLVELRAAPRHDHQDSPPLLAVAGPGHARPPSPLLAVSRRSGRERWRDRRYSNGRAGHRRRRCAHERGRADAPRAPRGRSNIADRVRTTGSPRRPAVLAARRRSRSWRRRSRRRSPAVDRLAHRRPRGRCSWIARHTRSGRSGMSMCRTPKGRSASTTAFTTAGVEPIVAASPMPFAPSGLTGVGVTVWSVTNAGRS